MSMISKLLSSGYEIFTGNVAPITVVTVVPTDLAICCPTLSHPKK